MHTNYFVSKDGDVDGPFTLGQMRSMWGNGKLTASHQICPEGGDVWNSIQTMASILEAAQAAESPKEAGFSTNKSFPSATSGADDVWDPNEDLRRGPRSKAAATTIARAMAKSERSRGIYVILALLLGGMGIHNFYIGRFQFGTLQLALGIFAAVAWQINATAAFMAAIATIILAAWIIFEMLAQKVDGNGLLLK